MSSKLKAVFYYDIISPFSYFYVMQRQRAQRHQKPRTAGMRRSASAEKANRKGQATANSR